MFCERIVYNLPEVTKIRFLRGSRLACCMRLSAFGILNNPFETSTSQMEVDLRCKL